MGNDGAGRIWQARGRKWAFGCVALLAVISASAAAEVGMAPPSKTERCPVCGMFVAGYSNWFAGIRFKDGSRATFDGPKDLFKYLSAMGKYEKKRTEADVAAIYVTEYYQVKPIDAKGAFYVTKSDVLGPMGEEFVPFGTQADAAGFLRDHKGQKVLTFADVLSAVRASGGKP